MDFGIHKDPRTNHPRILRKDCPHTKSKRHENPAKDYVPDQALYLKVKTVHQLMSHHYLWQGAAPENRARQAQQRWSYD